MNVSDSDISIPGYNIFRRDRNKNGDGVIVYTKETLVVKMLRHFCLYEALLPLQVTSASCREHPTLAHFLASFKTIKI